MAFKIRFAFLLSLFPFSTIAVFLLRPSWLDEVARRQFAVVCAGYALGILYYCVFGTRPAGVVRAMAREVRTAEGQFVRERAELQTRIDFLAAEREIGLILNEDVDFETILDKVLTVTNEAMGGGIDDEIEIHLQDGEEGEPVLRASRRGGKTRFHEPGRGTDSLVRDGFLHRRLLFSAEADRLDIVAPLASDGEVVGVARVRTRLEGTPEEKSVRAERLSRHLQEFSRFLALAVKTPGLYTRAVEDGLTGLATKRHFLNLLDGQMAEAARYGEPLSLVMADVDHFKKINDEHGHLAGDRVLQGVAALIRGSIRKGGDAAGFRYGGEEMGLLLPKTPLERAAAVAERLRASVEAKTFAGGIRLTVSLGVATFETGMSRDDLIGRADAALYRAKSGGRNRVVASSEVAA